MRPRLLAALLVAAPSLLAAQSPPRPAMLGGGIGILQNEEVSGDGPHAQAELTVLRLGDGYRLTAYGLYQEGEGTGSPLSCEQGLPGVCFGRTDRMRATSAGLALHRQFDRVLGVHPYLVPIGLGARWSRTRSRECWREVNLGGFQDRCATEAGGSTHFESSIGGGAWVPVGPVQLYTELRLLWAGGPWNLLLVPDDDDDDDRRPGSLAFTVGVRF